MVYDRIRTYDIIEPPSTERREWLVAFEENDAEDEEERPTKRRKGVYYKDVSRTCVLRKTRAKVGDQMELALTFSATTRRRDKTSGTRSGLDTGSPTATLQSSAKRHGGRCKTLHGSTTSCIG